MDDNGQPEPVGALYPPPEGHGVATPPSGPLDFPPPGTPPPGGAAGFRVLGGPAPPGPLPPVPPIPTGPTGAGWPRPAPPASGPPRDPGRRGWVVLAVSLAVVAVLLVAVAAVAVLARDDEATAGPEVLPGDPAASWPAASAPGSLSDDVLTAYEPADAEASNAAIRAAMATAVDPVATPSEWLAAVDAPAPVGERLRSFAPRCGAATVVVRQVVFMSDDSATVRFSFSGSPVPGADGITFSGTAERIDGSWKVTRYTIDKIILNAAPYCAPD